MINNLICWFQTLKTAHKSKHKVSLKKTTTLLCTFKFITSVNVTRTKQKQTEVKEKCISELIPQVVDSFSFEWSCEQRCFSVFFLFIFSLCATVGPSASMNWWSVCRPTNYRSFCLFDRQKNWILTKYLSHIRTRQYCQGGQRPSSDTGSEKQKWGPTSAAVCQRTSRGIPRPKGSLAEHL